jgi:predicted transcriptional regulator
VTKRRRSRAEVISDILEVAVEGALKTHIMYGANLSYAQLRRYLPLLLERGLLEARTEKGWMVYTTTREGVKLLKVGIRR